MMKMFLLDLWKVWRALEGLPVTESYAEAKLGIRHGEEPRFWEMSEQDKADFREFIAFKREQDRTGRRRSTTT